MRHPAPPSPRRRSAPTSEGTPLQKRLLVRIAQTTVVAAGALVVIHALSDDGAEAPRSALVISAEDATHDLLEDRTAVHLRRLRNL